MSRDIVKIIGSQIDLDEKYIKNIIDLFNEGCTVAFIARYRKDLSGNSDDETLLRFWDIYEYAQKLVKRREEIENILGEKDSLSPKIRSELGEALTLKRLEDIYEPFKGTKNTRADAAVKNGLTDLANIISTMKYSIGEIEQKAKRFFKQ